MASTPSLERRKTVAEQPFHSGFVALIGRPNVGKSTLVNRLVGEKVAIVSPKPQTTRSRMMGVMNCENAQVVLLDTPGIHKAKTRLGKYMIDSVQEALKGIDALCILLDVCDLKPADEKIAQNYAKEGLPCFLVLNKIDRVPPAQLLAIIDRFKDYPFKAIIPVSAKTGNGMDELKATIIDSLPQGPKYFPDDMITDQPERILVSEIIREKALLYLQEEIPHGIGIEIIAFEKVNEGFTKIHASIYCERDTHKRIIIGKQGQMIGKIGSAARRDIETLLDTHVHLDLWVKVRPGWRDSLNDLRTLGYVEEK
jgi:GTP-binding protein Era